MQGKPDLGGRGAQLTKCMVGYVCRTVTGLPFAYSQRLPCSGTVSQFYIREHSVCKAAWLSLH